METNRSSKKEALKAAVPVTIPVLTGFACPGRAVHGSGADSVCVNKEPAGSFLLFPNCHHLLRFRQDIPGKSQYPNIGKI